MSNKLILLSLLLCGCIPDRGHYVFETDDPVRMKLYLTRVKECEKSYSLQGNIRDCINQAMYTYLDKKYISHCKIQKKEVK